MYEKQRILFLSFFPCRKKEVESHTAVLAALVILLLHTELHQTQFPPGKVADQRRTDDKKSDKTIFLPLLAFFWSYFTHSIQFGLRRQRESKIGVSLQSQCLF